MTLIISIIIMAAICFIIIAFLRILYVIQAVFLMLWHYIKKFDRWNKIDNSNHVKRLIIIIILILNYGTAS